MLRVPPLLGALHRVPVVLHLGVAELKAQKEPQVWPWVLAAALVRKAGLLEWWKCEQQAEATERWEAGWGQWTCWPGCRRCLPGRSEFWRWQHQQESPMW